MEKGHVGSKGFQSWLHVVFGAKTTSRENACAIVSWIIVANHKTLRINFV